MSKTENSTDSLEDRFIEQASRSHLNEIVRRGARRMLVAALENEVDDYVENHKEITDEEGNQNVVKNGTSHHERTVQTGA